MIEDALIYRSKLYLKFWKVVATLLKIWVCGDNFRIAFKDVPGQPFQAYILHRGLGLTAPAHCEGTVNSAPCWTTFVRAAHSRRRMSEHLSDSGSMDCAWKMV